MISADRIDRPGRRAPKDNKIVAGVAIALGTAFLLRGLFGFAETRTTTLHQGPALSTSDTNPGQNGVDGDAPKYRISPSARAAYAGTPIGEYLNRFPGTRVDLADCKGIATPFGGENEFYVGMAVVGDPGDLTKPEDQKRGNFIHLLPELESPVVDTLNAQEAIPASRVLRVHFYGSEETWVDTGNGVVLVQARSGKVVDTYAGVKGLEECLQEAGLEIKATSNSSTYLK